MVTGIVDGSVRDQERGERILSLVRAVVPEGAFVRVSGTLVKVDISRCMVQNRDVRRPGEVRALPGADGSL